MHLQRWEAKIHRKEKSPQPGIELTTTRSRVWHAHHWATQAGLIPFSISKLLHCHHINTFTAQSRLSTTLKKKPFENIVGNGENAGITSIFSFSHNVFYSSRNKFHFFSYIYFVVCKCFQYGPVQKFVIWLRVNTFRNVFLLASGNHRLFCKSWN